MNPPLSYGSNEDRFKKALALRQHKDPSIDTHNFSSISLVNSFESTPSLSDESSSDGTTSLPDPGSYRTQTNSVGSQTSTVSQTSAYSQATSVSQITQASRYSHMTSTTLSNPLKHKRLFEKSSSPTELIPDMVWAPSSSYLTDDQRLQQQQKDDGQLHSGKNLSSASNQLPQMSYTAQSTNASIFYRASDDDIADVTHDMFQPLSDFDSFHNVESRYKSTNQMSSAFSDIDIDLNSVIRSAYITSVEHQDRLISPTSQSPPEVKQTLSITTELTQDLTRQQSYISHEIPDHSNRADISSRKSRSNISRLGRNVKKIARKIATNPSPAPLYTVSSSS